MIVSSRAAFQLTLFFGVCLLQASSFAHHAAQAQFAVDVQAVFEGRLTKIEMINPHPQLYFTVSDAQGDAAWRVEAPSVAVLRRVGILRSLRIGENYDVEYAPSRDGSTVALMIAITDKDGKRFGVNLGGSRS